MEVLLATPRPGCQLGGREKGFLGRAFTPDQLGAVASKVPGLLGTLPLSILQHRLVLIKRNGPFSLN